MSDPKSTTPATFRGLLKETASLSLDGGKTWTSISDHERGVLISATDAASVEFDRIKRGGK